MVKFSTLRAEQPKAPLLEGEQLKAKDITGKQISITKISPQLSGEFGFFKIVQARLGKKLVTFPLNEKTAVYEDLATMEEAIKAGKTIETKLKRIPSKSTKGRSYYQFE